MRHGLNSYQALQELSAKATPGTWKYKFHQIIKGIIYLTPTVFKGIK